MKPMVEESFNQILWTVNFGKQQSCGYTPTPEFKIKNFSIGETEDDFRAPSTHKNYSHTPPMKALIWIGPTVVPGTADWIGLCFRAIAATGSLYDIISAFTAIEVRNQQY